MKRKHTTYSPEFKTQAIALVREAKRPVVEVAKDLGMNTNTLYNWLSPGNPSQRKHSGETDSSAEIKQLKKKLAQAEMERDILKKAAAYFAKATL
jgi:transposase